MPLTLTVKRQGNYLPRALKKNEKEESFTGPRRRRNEEDGEKNGYDKDYSTVSGNSCCHE